MKHGNAALACRIDMQNGHMLNGQAAQTKCKDMQHGDKGKQYQLAAWTCIMYKQREMS